LAPLPSYVSIAWAILAAAVAILVFIAIAFRKVPNAYRYGVCAIVKMFHDVLVILGLASILGLLAGWEVDALFLTAMVTVVGFSVQDVIVVFDRIRENIRRRRGETFEVIVNRSLLETLHRSLATQLNAIFIMVAIIFFGGVTIRQFMIVMLIGMVSGTYSSLFFAVPLLAVWEQGGFTRLFRRARPAG
jgi:preprotein translocase SecF subunit